MAQATSQPLIEILAGISLFKDLPETAISQIAKAMRPVSFSIGQSIFGRGDAGAEFYIVLDGRVKISVLTAEGRELAFAHIGSGDLFGEIAMFDEGERTADATALTKVQAMSMTRASAMAIMEATPAFADAIIRFLCARLRQTDLQFEGVALHRIEVRLARFLNSLCSQTAPNVDEGEVSVTLPVSQGELALLVGASRPKVNGALMALEADGTLRRAGNTFICRVEDLRAIGEID